MNWRGGSSKILNRVLVIEDNEELAYGLQNNLEIDGYEVFVATDGLTGLHAAESQRPDLVILDLMLPSLDGFRLLRSIRSGGMRMPVLILTARDAEIDKVRGLKLGADDYMTKPFGVMELLARVEALIRRSAIPKAPPAGVERFGEVSVDCATRIVTRGGEQIGLRPKEFDLLNALLAREGKIATRIDLMREVWGYSDSVISRTIDTHVGELRKKLESDPRHPRHILTVKKVGYRFRR